MRLGQWLLAAWCVIVLVPITHQRVYQWADGEGTLWAEAARLAPQKLRPWLNAGNFLRLEGDLDAARLTYQHVQTLAQEPGRSVRDQQLGRSLAAANLGLVAIDAGDLPRARACLADAVAANPNNQDIVAAWTWFTRQYRVASSGLPPCS